MCPCYGSWAGYAAGTREPPESGQFYDVEMQLRPHKGVDPRGLVHGPESAQLLARPSWFMCFEMVWRLALQV